jgi:hypothetical protein
MHNKRMNYLRKKLLISKVYLLINQLQYWSNKVINKLSKQGG